jgi:hypothetical protein
VDVGLVGAGILSGVLGAHIVTVLREKLSLGTWVDSLLGALGGAICAHLVALASLTWVDTTVGLAVGRIAAVIVAGILGGAALLLFAGLFRSRRPVSDDDDGDVPPIPERRSTASDRRQGERRLSEHDV